MWCIGRCVFFVVYCVACCVLCGALACDVVCCELFAGWSTLVVACYVLSVCLLFVVLRFDVCWSVRVGCCLVAVACCVLFAV